jgi:hypothetical protein
VAEYTGLLCGMIGGSERFDIAIEKWPGRPDVQIGLRLLSSYQQAAAKVAARAWCKAHDASDDDALFTTRLGAECLAAILVDPNTKEPLVPSADELLSLCTMEEMQSLVELMGDHQEACAPEVYALSEDELAKMGEALGKSPRAAATLLRGCAPSTLRRCITLLVNQPKNQAQPSS